MKSRTAVAGWALEINPFDQPNVQEAKDNTARVLREGPPELADGDVGELLDGLEPPASVSIHGYLPYDDAFEAAVARLRRRSCAARGPRRRGDALPAAQADGDLQTLRAHERPAVRVRLPAGSEAAAIDEIAGRIR